MAPYAGGLRRIPSALQKLHTKGLAALLPEKIVDPMSTLERWKKPVVSRRIAKDLRKRAIKNGTYGAYDPEKGIGWDKSWDEGLFGGKNVGKINWMEVRGFKDTKRERTRESRAQRVEGLLEVADDKIVEFRQKSRDNKPEGGVVNDLKRLIKGSSK